MTLMGQCEECGENRRPGQPIERRKLYRGPDGRKLCREHYRAAIDEEITAHTTVENRSVTADSFEQIAELVGSGSITAESIIIDGLEISAEGEPITVSREST